ncbi:hypothetical protein, partial [Escherichia coli]|uniref:hypothetical protein n=1 Tax=Escherichia coli TaxID=562 RepID=UPI001BB48210
VNDFMDSVHHIWCPLFSQEFQDLPDGAETTLTNKRENRGVLYQQDLCERSSGRITRKKKPACFQTGFCAFQAGVTSLFWSTR